MSNNSGELYYIFFVDVYLYKTVRNCYRLLRGRCFGLVYILMMVEYTNTYIYVQKITIFLYDFTVAKQLNICVQFPNIEMLFRDLFIKFFDSLFFIHLLLLCKFRGFRKV